MRNLALFGLSLVVSISAFVVVPTNYHDCVGIPAAKRIRAIEKEILAKKDLEQKDLLENRIIGGVQAPPNVHPYFAGLLIDLLAPYGGQSVCGASLLTPNRLVTAAHCWFDGWRQGWQIHVTLGSNLLYYGGERISTNLVKMHPQYSRWPLTNDIAMIYLPRYAYIDNFSVKPINLPKPYELQNQFVGYSAVATGFGKISDQHPVSNELRHVCLNVISQAECAAALGWMADSYICTSGKGGAGICSGDSGGPLAVFGNYEPFLIGIVSFTAGFNCSTPACQGGQPSAFTRVTSFYSFITQHL